MLLKFHLIDFYSQTSPFSFSHYLPGSHAFNPNPEATVLLLLFFLSCTAGMRRRKTENRKRFNVGIKLSACFCHITLISSSPANPHRSTTYPPNAKNGKKTHNTRWFLPLKTKLLNARTIQREHKEEHRRAAFREDLDAQASWKQQACERIAKVH